MKKTTGPHTNEGKAISRQNAITHGMTSTLILIDGEIPADLDAHFAQWHLQYPADNEIAQRLVARAALSEWHLLRLERQFNTASSNLLATPITAWSDADHARYKNLQRYLTTGQRTHHRDRLTLQQHRAQLRSEEIHQIRLAKANAETSQGEDKTPKGPPFTNFDGPKPPCDWPLYQDVFLEPAPNGQPWVNVQPSNAHILLNTDDSLETRPVIRRIHLRGLPVAPGYQWVLDSLQKAPPDCKVILFRHTAKSFRIIAERENGGPVQRWDDLLIPDRFILDNKLKGPLCQPRINKDGE